jgi:hypothetical protein
MLKTGQFLAVVSAAAYVGVFSANFSGDPSIPSPGAIVLFAIALVMTMRHRELKAA